MCDIEDIAAAPDMRQTVSTLGDYPPLNLLLDFDGVLHPYTPCAPTDHDFRCDPPRLHPDVFCQVPYVEAAVRTLEGEGIAVLIHLTTSWRKVVPLVRLRRYLGDYLSSRTVGVTPIVDDDDRAAEVGMYLINLARFDDPWIAIDDNLPIYEGFLRLPNSAQRLLFVDEATGFTLADTDRLVAKARHLCLGHPYQPQDQDYFLESNQ